MSVKRTVLQSFPVPELPGYESRMLLIDYPPGQVAPLHTHPVPGNGFVLSGHMISQFEGGEVEVYRSGESFMDQAETKHIQAANGSKTEWLRFIVVYVIPIGEANINTVEGA